MAAGDQEAVTASVRALLLRDLERALERLDAAAATPSQLAAQIEQWAMLQRDLHAAIDELDPAAAGRLLKDRESPP